MQTLCGTLLQPAAPAECRVTDEAIVRIGEDGKFAGVAAGPAPRGAVGGPGCWILPGFVDAHLHLPHWDRRGIDGLGLFEFLEQVVWPAETRMVDPDVAEHLAESFVSGMIAHGTTTVAAFGSPFPQATQRVFEVFERRGLRAIHGMMLNDTECPAGLDQEADASLEDSRQLAARWHGAAGGRLQYAFSPRTPLMCSLRQMRGAAALAGMFGCHIQTHAAESLIGVERVRERFPEALDEIEVFAEMGLLTGRTLLGHGVHLNQHQRRQVAAAGTTVIHCPKANLFLQTGLMDYVAHRDSGVRVALGSGIGGGFDPFMPRVAVDALQTAKAVKVHGLPRGTSPVPTVAEAWWLLTRGAAEALGLGDRVGLIATGMEADCLVVRPEPWIADLEPSCRPSALLYSLRPDQIEHVYIAGRHVGP